MVWPDKNSPGTKAGASGGTRLTAVGVVGKLYAMYVGLGRGAQFISARICWRSRSIGMV